MTTSTLQLDLDQLDVLMEALDEYMAGLRSPEHDRVREIADSIVPLLGAARIPLLFE